MKFTFWLLKSKRFLTDIAISYNSYSWVNVKQETRIQNFNSSNRVLYHKNTVTDFLILDFELDWLETSSALSRYQKPAGKIVPIAMYFILFFPLDSFDILSKKTQRWLMWHGGTKFWFEFLSFYNIKDLR